MLSDTFPPFKVEVTDFSTPGSSSIRTPDSSPVRTPTNVDPLTCRIVPGRETTIEVQKGKTGLGLSIIGGSDTLLVFTFVFCSL